MGKNLSTTAGDSRDTGRLLPWVRKSPLEEETVNSARMLAWKIPWTEEPGRATIHGVTKSQMQLSNGAQGTRTAVGSQQNEAHCYDENTTLNLATGLGEIHEVQRIPT